MRTLLLSIIATTLFSTVMVASLSAEDQIFGGKVVAVIENKLMMSDSAGQMMQTYTLTENAKVTLNGKGVALTDLMAGDNLTVTLDGQKVKLITAVRSKKV